MTLLAVIVIGCSLTAWMISATITQSHMHIIMLNVTFVKMCSPIALIYKHTDNKVAHLHLQPQPDNNKKQPIHRICDHFLFFWCVSFSVWDRKILTWSKVVLWALTPPPLGPPLMWEPGPLFRDYITLLYCTFVPSSTHIQNRVARIRQSCASL